MVQVSRDAGGFLASTQTPTHTTLGADGDILFGTGFFLYSALAQAKNFSAIGLERSKQAWYRS